MKYSAALKQPVGASFPDRLWSLNYQMLILHSTPKESIHFEFWRVSTQNLLHVEPMRGYEG